MRWWLGVDEQPAHASVSYGDESSTDKGHGLLGSFGVGDSNFQPIVVEPGKIISLEIEVFDPLAGTDISTLGGYILGKIYGFILNTPSGLAHF